MDIHPHPKKANSMGNLTTHRDEYSSPPLRKVILRAILWCIGMDTRPRPKKDNSMGNFKAYKVYFDTISFCTYLRTLKIYP